MLRTIAAAAALPLAGILISAPVVGQGWTGDKPMGQQSKSAVSLAHQDGNEPFGGEPAEFLIRSYPELAAVAADYRATLNESRTTNWSNAARSVPRFSSPGCATATGAHHAKTLLGFTFYKMETSVYYCWDAIGVYRVDPPVTKFSEISITARVNKAIEQFAQSAPSGTAGHKYSVENVVPYWGTLSVKYPFNYFDFDDNGGFLHSDGE